MVSVDDKSFWEARGQISTETIFCLNVLFLS